MSSLFRKEVLEHKQSSIMGDVILIRPTSFYFLTGFSVLFAICLLFVIFFGKYADKETVNGRLIPNAGIVKVFAPQAGVITNVAVKDGQDVTAGQVLMTLDSESSLESGDSVNNLILDELKESLVKMQEDRANIEKEYVLKEKNLQNRLSSIKNELENLSAQTESQKRVVLFANQRAKREKELFDKGVISLDKSQRAYEEFISQKANYDATKGRKIAKETELTQLKGQLEQLPVEREHSLSNTDNNISALKQKIIQAEGQKKVAIISPVSGKVTSMQAQIGSYHRGVGRAPLVSILPEGSELIAEIYVISKAIGFVRPGQEVRVKYRAFPYQSYGVYKGKISEIAKNALMPEEFSETTSLPATFQINEPVYRIKIDLDRQSVKAFGKELPLHADMLLEADIVLRERTIFEKIFLDPIYRFKGSI